MNGVFATVVSITCINKPQEFLEWESTINKWINKQKLLIPQHMPLWYKIFNNLREGLSFYLIIAHEDNEIRDCLSFTIFDGPFGEVIHSNPYIVYGGFTNKDEHIWMRIFNKLFEVARNKNCITVTLCTPPYQESEIEIYKQLFIPDYCFENFYQFNLLENHPFENIKTKRRATFKNEIKRGILNGISLTIEKNIKQWELWYAIYKQRYAEIGAIPFPKDIFISIYKTFVREGKAVLFCAYKKDILLGGVLILLGNNTADYFVSAFRSDSDNLFPNTIVLDSIFNWLIKRNYHLFNWESSPGRNGVYKYKSRWGAQEGTHVYMTKIIGDTSRLLNERLDIVKKEYNGLFVLPYDLWGEKE